jgi:hypothetical protein
MKTPLLLVAVLAGLAIAAGCGAHGSGHHETFVASLAQAEGGAEHGVTSLPHLGGEALVKTEGHANAADFFVQSRAGKISKSPCQQCHNVPLARMRHDGKDGKASAHWSIQLKHAGEEVMNCRTCHLEGDVNQLRTLTNQPVPMDHGYKVCAQCHSQQAADWAGGSHGKRAGGWAPPRVVKSCVECHNPHQPAWDERWPAYSGRVRE